MTIASSESEAAAPPAERRETVSFTKEKETLLITLFGRALQSAGPNPILADPWAEELVGRIDYDFARLDVGERTASFVACRAAQLDAWTADFVAAHPVATILHLGCGLDSRAFRVAVPVTVRWFDVDYPDVIELRRKLYPERANYQTIGASLADLAWLGAVPNDRPVLVVAEGVTMYLTEGVVKALLNRVVAYFPEGRIAFDAHTPEMVRWFAKAGVNARGTGATFHWGLGKPGSITVLEPALELVEERRLTQLSGYPRMPWRVRVLARALDMVPSLRVMRCLLYRF